jgi:hypothetical protein
LKLGEVPLLNHLVGNLSAQSRIDATAAALQFFLKTIHSQSSWGDRLKKHFATFPSMNVNRVEQAGFPEGGENLPLWK